MGTNTNGSSTSTSTQTSQPSVRTRIIVDDFIALISNVPASMAAAAAQGQVPPGMPGVQHLSQTQGQGASTATTTGQPQPQAQAQSVPTPGVQSATPGQEQARPQGLPAGLSMNLLSGMPPANSNHPDPSLPCQSFHFGPQGQRAQPQQTSQQSTQSTTSATTTSTQAQTPVTSTPQSQTREGVSGQTANPVNPPPAQERPRPPPEPRRTGS